MNVGPFALPALALLMVIYLLYATAALIFDGTRPEEDIDVLDEDMAEAETPRHRLFKS